MFFLLFFISHKIVICSKFCTAGLGTVPIKNMFLLYFFLEDEDFSLKCCAEHLLWHGNPSNELSQLNLVKINNFINLAC